MENKEAKRKEVLRMLWENTITMEEALEMLKKLEEPSIVKWAKGEQEKKYSLKEEVEAVISQTVASLNIDKCVEIMQGMKWTYGFENHVVTREEVIKCAEENVRTAIYALIKNQMEENWPLAMTGTGGFQCRAWVDEDDWDNIQVELAFQPYSGFGEGHLQKLIDLKKQETKCPKKEF